MLRLNMSGTPIFPPRRCFAGSPVLAGLLLVAMLGAALMPAPASAGLVEGLRKYEAGDYAGAILEWQPMAERGNADALFNLGQVYRLGRGVAADASLAIEYYRRAGDAGHAGARGALATLYYFDNGTRQKRGQAIALWRQAAAAGDAPSQYALAILHFNGQDVPKDLMQAYAWALLAAEGGLDEGRKAERSIEPHLSPNQIAQARVLMGGLVPRPPVSAPATAPAPPPAPPPASPTVQVAEVAQVAPVPEPEPELEAEPEAVPETVEAVAVETGAPEEEPAAETPPPSTPPPSTVASASPNAALLQGDMEMEKPGSWSVQLGYYRSLIYAESYWQDIAPRVAELQPGIEGRIVTIDRGPERGIFRRLLVGSFAMRPDAVSLCNNLKTIGIDCVVIEP